jgi:excisionase family DNA binding protein
MPTTNNEVIMTASEVASFLKVSVGAVRRWTRDGNLKGHRLGGKGDWRYFRRDVMRFVIGTN